MVVLDGLQQGRDAVGADDPALDDESDPVAQPFRLLDVMRGQEYGGTGAAAGG